MNSGLRSDMLAYLRIPVSGTMRVHRYRLNLLLALATLAVASLVGFFGLQYSTRTFLDEAEQRGRNTLGLAVAALRGEMARYEKLPALIADHLDVKRLAASPSDPLIVAQVNAYLKEINTLLESSDIYVMAPDGTTIAASNYDLEITFVGENFRYRPYFLDAINGGLGRFFALGTTSLKRGYYFGAPIRDGNRITGVVVFKVDVDSIESSWKGGDYEIIVTDPEGIIFMTGRAEWLYSAILPLTDERRARTAETRRYANADLRDLPVKRTAYDRSLELMNIASADGDREYLVIAEDMPEAGWTVKVLLDTVSVRAQAFTTIFVVVLIIALAAMAIAALLQHRARLRERIELQREAREQLEKRVAERTTDLAEVNTKLEREVAERRATEMQLRKTQSDLVQAGKLAALGQMSAALSHEFNQPLAAAKTYADNASLLLDRGRVKEAGENIARISSLTDRMSAISRHLRNFARKPNERLQPVFLPDVIADTREIVGWRLKTAGAELFVDAEPATVMAGSVRLQQVLVNILTNAADAVETVADRRIDLVVRTTGRKVEISVRDRGPGIAPGLVERIFDPFFSTKGVGKGLGLGLSISYNIIKDFGGSLRAANLAEGGAEFVIELDAAEAGAALEDVVAAQ